MTDTNPPTSPDEATPDARVTALLRIIEEEISAVSVTLPLAYARQWEASPIPKPREDTAERSSGGRPANPTLDTVLDPQRLAVRDAVVRVEKILRDTAVALRGSRLGIERVVARFDGEGA